MTITMGKYCPRRMVSSLLQLSSVSVPLVLPEELEAGLQPALEFGIAGQRSESPLKRAVHGLCNFFGNVSLIELSTV
jgi:hypothetical protein